MALSGDKVKVVGFYHQNNHFVVKSKFVVGEFGARDLILNYFQPLMSSVLVLIFFFHRNTAIR